MTQTVTVTGSDDNLVDGTVTSTITVAVDDANTDDDFPDAVTTGLFLFRRLMMMCLGSRLLNLMTPQMLMSQEPLTHSLSCWTAINIRCGNRFDIK